MDNLHFRHCFLKSKSGDARDKKHDLELDLANANLGLEKYDGSYKSDTNVHMGQRKLLLSEMQVFNEYYVSLKKKKPTHKPVVVYVGSCPGHHLHVIHGLYPDLIFHLYDGAEESRWNKDLIHAPYPGWKVHTGENGYFTTDVCKALKAELDGMIAEPTAKKVVATNKSPPILFVCDIRLDGKGFDDFEDNVARDMTLQKDWTKILKPEFTMLKFRLPYTLSKVPGNPKWPYLKGRLYFGIWSPPMSGETRLMVRKKDVGDTITTTVVVKSNKIPALIDDEVEYDYLKYEQANVYHNKFDRPYCFGEFGDFVSQDDTGYIHSEYCPCYDCIAELKVIKQYVECVAKYTNTTVAVKTVQSVAKYINDTLFVPDTSIQQIPKNRAKNQKVMQYI